MRTGFPVMKAKLQPKPEWQPRYRGSDRLAGIPMEV